jgi:hypothetical protein
MTAMTAMDVIDCRGDLTSVQKRMKKAWVTRRMNKVEDDSTLTSVQKRMKKAWVTIRANAEAGV